MKKAFLPVLLAALWAGAAVTPAQAGKAPYTERQKALIHMVREDCGSCHGLTLKGGLGPSLLPQAIGGKDAEMLKNTILQGRAGTPMPPWQTFLTDDEARWIVEQLQKGFPDEIH